MLRCLPSPLRRTEWLLSPQPPARGAVDRQTDAADLLQEDVRTALPSPRIQSLDSASVTFQSLWNQTLQGLDHRRTGSNWVACVFQTPPVVPEEKSTSSRDPRLTLMSFLPGRGSGLTIFTITPAVNCGPAAWAFSGGRPSSLLAAHRAEKDHNCFLGYTDIIVS